MGLRKINESGGTSYMYTNISESAEILVLLLGSATSFSVKLNTESDAVKKWCHNLQKSPQEYMTLFREAVETCSVTYGDDESSSQDVFEIKEDCLVWKQFFPDKNVYGRRGKFTLEMISNEDAVKEVLNGTIGDLDTRSHRIQTLTEDLDKKSKELQRAKDLAATSVKEKESFEKEVYGKFVSLINAKKLKIRQLMSSQPSTSGEAATAVRKILTNTHSSSQPGKLIKSSNLESDGYSSDTDVDDPNVDDIDTDEENAQKAAVPKRKLKSDNKSKPPTHAFDSQDDLFNNSLEAELYSTDLSKKPKLMKQSLDIMDKKDFGINKGTKASTKDYSSSHEVVSTSQRSIIDELF